MEPIVSRLELWNLEVTQGAGSQEWLEAYECMGYTKIKVESLLVIVHLSAYMKWERFYARKDALNISTFPGKVKAGTATLHWLTLTSLSPAFAEHGGGQRMAGGRYHSGCVNTFLYLIGCWALQVCLEVESCP